MHGSEIRFPLQDNRESQKVLPVVLNFADGGIPAPAPDTSFGNEMKKADLKSRASIP